MYFITSASFLQEARFFIRIFQESGSKNLSGNPHQQYPSRKKTTEKALRAPPQSSSFLCIYTVQ